jgi:hypothetical protein
MAGKVRRQGRVGEEVVVQDEKSIQGHDDPLSFLVGDGAAKVTVSTDRSNKYMGSGVSVFVSVTLTCNQDRTTIERAYEEATAICLDQIVPLLQHVEDVWEEVDRLRDE